MGETLVKYVAVPLLALALVLFAPRRASAVTPSRKVHVAICRAFGSYCQQALRVSWCESRWRPWARNGQYFGLFQMGRAERAKYGDGRSALSQSLAAARYFRAMGRSWSPWACGYAS